MKQQLWFSGNFLDFWLFVVCFFVVLLYSHLLYIIIHFVVCAFIYKEKRDYRLTTVDQQYRLISKDQNNGRISDAFYMGFNVLSRLLMPDHILLRLYVCMCIFGELLRYRCRVSKFPVLLLLYWLTLLSLIVRFLSGFEYLLSWDKSPTRIKPITTINNHSIEIEQTCMTQYDCNGEL